ncbi:MAG TPA: TIGR02281 family clan AA aspartic protease, partial [Beijerinckiaceae bacterium]
MSEPLKLLVAAGVIGVTAALVVPRYLDQSRKPPPASAPLAAAPAAPAPEPTTRATGGRVEIAPDAHGQFLADTEIDGRRMRMLVDTGASFVALSHEDADRLGIRPFPSDYKVPVATANGRIQAAQITLRQISIASLSARDVPALVLPA